MTIKYMPESSEWAEKAPGIYERPMGENEKFIKFIGDRAHPVGREQWSVVAAGTLKLNRTGDPKIGGNLNADVVQLAWENLRFQHPSIACRTKGEILSYTVGSESVIEDWLNESFFIVQDPAITLNDVIANLRPSPVATIHFLEQTSQVVIGTAHWRTDGYGAFHLLNGLFSALASALDSAQGIGKLAWGSEVGRLVPTLEFALELSLDASEEILHTCKRYLATGASLVGSVGLASPVEPVTRPRGTRHVSLALPSNTTKQLMEKCSTHGVSVYSAVHAAVAAAVYTGASPQDHQKHYTSTIRLNPRPFLPWPYNTAAGASALYTGGYLFPVPAGQPLLARAKAYEAEYNSGVSEDFLRSRRAYARLALEYLRKLTGPPPQSSNVDVSFVRDADKIVSPAYKTRAGDLEVVDLSLGVNTLTRQPYCFFWVFNGALQLQLWFNESFYDVNTAAEILQVVHDNLVSELL
jgi:hypothetical protein